MSQSQQERVDRLMSKLQHPLDDVRRRSLQNLASKVSAGLVAPERVVSDVIATRSLVSLLQKTPAATAELSEVLHVLELVASKDAWSAAVLVDAGALTAVQSLMDSSSNSLHSESKLTGGSPEEYDERLKTLAKILYSVPPQKVHQLHSFPEDDSSSSSSGSSSSSKFDSPQQPSRRSQTGSTKVESPPRRDTKQPDTPDRLERMLATTESSTSTHKAVASGHARGGWCFPRVEVTRQDDQLLFRAKAELSSGDPSRQLSVVSQLNSVLSSDFPCEIFLQRPEIFRMLLTLLRSTKESHIPSDTIMLEATVQCLETLLQQWNVSLKRVLDHEMHPSTEVANSNESTAMEAKETTTTTASSFFPATTYPSGHAGTIVFTPTTSVASISRGDAALMIVMSGLPTTSCNSIHVNILFPLLRTALTFLSEPFPIRHVTVSGMLMEHLSWTAARFQTVMDAVSQQFSMAAASSTATTMFRTMTHLHFLHLTFHEITSSGLGIVDSTIEPSATSISLSDAVIEHVRTSLFCYQSTDDDLDEDVWSTLTGVMRSIDRKGAQLMDVTEQIVASTMAALTEYDEKEVQKNEEKKEVEEKEEVERKESKAVELSSATARSMVLNLLRGVERGEMTMSASDLMALCQRRLNVLSNLLPSLMTLRTIEDEVELLKGGGEEHEMHRNQCPIDRHMCATIVSDILALCCLIFSCSELMQVGGEKETEGSDSNLRIDTLSILSRLMSHPMPQVKITAYEQLLSSITMRTLGVGTESFHLSEQYVTNILVGEILSHEMIMNELVYQGTSDRAVRGQAKQILQSIVSITTKNSEGGERGSRLHKYVPVLSSLLEYTRVGEDGGVTKREERNEHVIGLKHIVNTMSNGDRALLLLQSLTEKDSRKRQQAARELRNMSSSVLKQREDVSDEYVDPAMLRQPMLHTSNQFIEEEDVNNPDSAAYHRQQVDLLVSRAQVDPTPVEVQQIMTLLESPTMEDSIWCTAAEHISLLLRVEAGDQVAVACGAHSNNLDVNGLLRLVGVVLMRMSLSSESPSLLTRGYVLLLLLAGRCDACCSSISLEDVLITRIIPDVFHPNDQVRYAAHRLCLLLVYHPTRMIPQVSGGGSSINGGINGSLSSSISCSSKRRTMNLIDIKYITSSASTPATEVVVPVLHLPEFVLSTCDPSVLRSMTSSVSQSFVPSKTIDDAYFLVGVHSTRREQRTMMLRYVDTQSHGTSYEGRAAAMIVSLVSSINNSRSHEEFLRATKRLRRACRSHPALRDAFGSLPCRSSNVEQQQTQETTAWLPPFRRMLRTAPRCEADRQVLLEILLTLKDIVPSMNSASLFALSSLVKSTLLTLIQQGSESSQERERNASAVTGGGGGATAAGEREGPSNEVNIQTSFYLATKKDLYAQVGEGATYTEEEESWTNLSVVSMDIITALTEAVRKRSIDDILQETILFVTCETRTLYVLADSYALNNNSERIRRSRNSRPVRTDASYAAQRAMTNLYLCACRALSSSRVAKNHLSTSGRKARNKILSVPTMIRSCVQLLQSINFQRFQHSTLARTATTLLRHAVEMGHTNIIMEEMSRGEILNGGSSSSSSWTVTGCKARDVHVRANVVSLSLSLSSLSSIQTIQRAMEYVRRRAEPPIVRSFALDGAVAALETLYRKEMAEEEEDDEGDEDDEDDDDNNNREREEASTWFVQHFVHGGTFADLLGGENASGSMRCAASAIRTAAFLLLVATSWMDEHLQTQTKTILLRTVEIVQQRFNLQTCWHRTLSSLLKNTYCPASMFRVGGREVGLLSSPPDVRSYLQQRMEDEDRERDDDVTCGRIVVETMHSLWEEMHSFAAVEMLGTNALVLRTIVEERTRQAITESEEAAKSENKLESELESELESMRRRGGGRGEDYAFKYNEDEEDDLVSSYERSIDAAMNTLVGCWRVIDSNDVTNEEAIVSMMDAATRLLCSVVPAHDFRFAVDKSRRNSAVTLDFVSLTPLVEKGMRSSSLSSSWRRLSTSSSHLLSVLLASRDATRVVEVLNIPVVTDILATCYMRKYTSSMMKSTNSFASAAASTTSTHDDDDANDWFVPFCSLLQRSNERSSSSEVACNMGVVYFALRQIEKCHRDLTGVLGRPPSSADVTTAMKDLSTHYQILTCLLKISSIGRSQCVRLEGAKILKRSWFVLLSLSQRQGGGARGGGGGGEQLLCQYLRLLAALTCVDGRDGVFVHHEVFSVPVVGEEGRSGGRTSSSCGAYYHGGGSGGAGEGRSSSMRTEEGSLLPIRPVTSQPTSLMTSLIVLMLDRVERVVRNLSHWTVVSASDMEVLTVVCSLVTQLAKDKPTAKVLARMPLIHNVIVLLHRLSSVASLSKPLRRSSSPLSSKGKKSNRAGVRKHSCVVRQSLLHVMLSMSFHTEEHGCFHSHGRRSSRKGDVDVYSMLLQLWRQCSGAVVLSGSSSASTSTSASTSKTSSSSLLRRRETGLVGHLLRNLSLTNKSKFIAQPTLLEEMLESVLAEKQPIAVACAASVLWSISFNCKKIIPRMKKCNAELVCQRGLEILQLEMLQGDGDQYITNIMLHGVQGLTRLLDWCKTNGAEGFKSSP